MNSNLKIHRKGSEAWDPLADAYREKVYSITSFPEKVARILETIRQINREQIRILIVGCGSEIYLQKAILNEFSDAQIVATDWSKKMLRVSRSNFNDNRLTYVRADTCNLPSSWKKSFDIVLTTNSIIPETRTEIAEMYSSIFKTLRPGGKLVGYFPSYEACEDAAAEYPEIKDLLIPDICGLNDTTGPQCFHTRDALRAELGEAGFNNLRVTKIGAESPEEMKTLTDLYKVPPELIEEVWHEFFVAAEKPRKKVEVKKDYILETIPSCELDGDTIRGIAYLYTLVFNQDGHYLYFPEAEEFWPPGKIFGKCQVGIEKMYSLGELPTHPATGERAIFWHDLTTTEKVIAEKLQKDAFATIAKNEEGKIIGFLFANKTTLGKAFEQEGWQNPGYYAGVHLEERDYQLFEDRLKEALVENPKLESQELTSETPIFAWNAVAASQEFKGLFPMMSTFFENLPEDWKKELLVLGETRYHSSAHNMFRALGFVDIDGVLCLKCKSAEDSLLLINNLEEVAEIVTNTKNFKKAIVTCRQSR